MCVGIHPQPDEDMMKILSARESVKRRNSYGGTGFKQVRQQIEKNTHII